MRPLRVLSLQKDNETDFVADCVLDLLSDFPKATPTQTIVEECNKYKVSSPDDKDGRKCYIKVSSKGMEYLNKWEGTLK